jgi:transposase-like protein
MARQGRERDVGKEQFWRDVVRQWRQSGSSIAAFCAAHGLPVSSFYAWRRTIAQRDERATGQAKSAASSGELPAFVPVRVTPAAAAPALEVVIGPGRVIRVLPGFDAATLRHLLAVLEEAASC